MNIYANEIRRLASLSGITPEAKTLLDEAARAQERGYDPSAATDAVLEKFGEEGRGVWKDFEPV